MALRTHGLPALVILALGVFACGDEPSPGGPGAGPGLPEAGSDAEVTADGGGPFEGGAPDGGGLGEAGAPDAASGDAAMDAGPAEDGGAGSLEVRALVGPEYAGSLDNGADCATTYPTQGFAPVDGAGPAHPLFLYFVGTAFFDDPSSKYDNVAAMAVAKAMAQRGFVALSVGYDNGALAWLSDHENQLACLFDAGRPESLIAKACALPSVNCGLGIATWGHSQGGYVAVRAHDVEPRVRAAWATGYGGDGSPTLDTSRLRVANGENDVTGNTDTLNPIFGFTPADCPDPDQCLRDDGSGWILVRQADLAMPDTGSADHCWFDRTSCNASEIRLEPNWVEPDSTKAFALSPNADWLARTARRPD